VHNACSEMYTDVLRTSFLIQKDQSRVLSNDVAFGGMCWTCRRVHAIYVHILVYVNDVYSKFGGSNGNKNL